MENYSFDKSSGIPPEEHKRIVDAGLDIIKKHKTPAGPKTDVEIMMAKYGEVLNLAYEHCQQKFNEMQKTGTVNAAILANGISHELIQELRTWSKDDLLLLQVASTTHGLMYKLLN